MGDVDYDSMIDSGAEQLLGFAKSVDPDAIQALADSWKQLSQDIPEAYQNFKNGVNGVFGSEWTGEAARSASAASDRLCQGMNNNIERVANMRSKLQGFAEAAHKVKGVADWAEQALSQTGLKTQEYQEIGQALASALHGLYGAQGQDPLGDLPPFEKVAPLVFSKPDEMFGESSDEKPRSGLGGEDPADKGDGKEEGRVQGQGQGQGQGAGSGAGSPAGGAGAGQGSGGLPMGSGTPAGADLNSTDPMSSDLAPIDPALAAGGGGFGGGVGGVFGGDKEKKLAAAPAKAEAASKPVVNVSTPGLDALHGQQAMGSGVGGVGGMGGGHGAGGDGKAIKTPDYLINNEHGFDLVGHALPVVSPEVIGELDKSEIQKMEANREKIAQETVQRGG